MDNLDSKQSAARREAAIALAAIDRRGQVESCWIGEAGGGGTIFRTVRPLGLTKEQRDAWRGILAVTESTPQTYRQLPEVVLTRSEHAWLLKRPIRDLIACLSAGLWSDGTMTNAVNPVRPNDGPTPTNILASIQRSAAELLTVKEIEWNFLEVVVMLTERRAQEYAALVDALLRTGKLREDGIRAVLAEAKRVGKGK